MIYSPKHIIVCTYSSCHHPYSSSTFASFLFLQIFPVYISLSPSLYLSLLVFIFLSVSCIYNLLSTLILFICTCVQAWQKRLENLCESLSLKETILLLSAALTICKSSCRSRTMWNLPHQGCHDKGWYHDVGFDDLSCFSPWLL